MSKMPLFENKIVTDNSKVIAALQNTVETRNKTIIEMSQMLNKLQQERDELKRPIELGDRITFTKANLEANNLEQQASICEKMAREAYKDTKEGQAYEMLLTRTAIDLRSKAKGES